MFQLHWRVLLGNPAEIFTAHILPVIIVHHRGEEEENKLKVTLNRLGRAEFGEEGDKK